MLQLHTRRRWVALHDRRYSDRSLAPTVDAEDTLVCVSPRFIGPSEEKSLRKSPAVSCPIAAYPERLEVEIGVDSREANYGQSIKNTTKCLDEAKNEGPCRSFVNIETTSTLLLRSLLLATS